jgi:hypothetical protein
MRRFLPLVAFFLAVMSGRAAEALAVALSGEPGPYSILQWKRDWPGCEFEDGVKQGRLTLTERESRRWLRVAYTPGAIGPEENGAGWRYPFPRQEAVELSYTVEFASDFEWVKGGKLPGLAGGPENVSGGRPANGINGWSARLMWRAEGRGEAYVYHRNQPGKYGESFAFPADFRFPTGVPLRVRLRVKMNRPGHRDGALHVWLGIGTQAERLMVERSDLEWRTVDTFGVDSIYFETFYGGSGPEWAPTRPGWAEFADFRAEFMR